MCNLNDNYMYGSWDMVCNGRTLGSDTFADITGLQNCLRRTVPNLWNCLFTIFSVLKLEVLELIPRNMALCCMKKNFLDGFQLSQGYRATTRRQFTLKNKRMCTFSNESLNTLNLEYFADSTDLSNCVAGQSDSSMFFWKYLRLH